MSNSPVKQAFATIKAKTLLKPKTTFKRLMGFREWCEKIYEPSKALRAECDERKRLEALD